MKFSFRKLPLTYQLLLTGIIPLLALLYLTWQWYSEKENRVSVVSAYNSRIQESGELASLTGELETEAEFSLSFVLNKGRYSTLVIQRSRTDKWIHKLEECGDTAITNFLMYTFRSGLAAARGAQDDGTAGIDTKNIMNFYHDAIWNLSASYAITPSDNTILKPLDAAVETQRMLFEMGTFLAITRNRIYVYLLTDYDTPAIVLAAGKASHTLKTDEAAFLVKATPPMIKMYNDRDNAGAIRPAFVYLDYAVIHHQFDSTDTPQQWWTIASGGIKVLHEEFQVSQQQLQTGMVHIYQSGIKARKLTLILLVAAILLLTAYVIFTVIAMKKVLKKQVASSAKADPGAEPLPSQNHSKDNVSDLILEAIYRAGKPNGVAANGITNGDNGHAIPGLKSEADKKVAPGINSKITTNRQETGWKRNETALLPPELNKPQENPTISVNDDLANYAVPKPEILPVVNGTGDNREVVKENIATKTERRNDSLTSQMNELIDAAAIENGRFNYHKHIFKLNDLVSEMVDETGKAIPSYKISLRKNAPLSVYGDRARIAQVLGNLLQNAIDHCPHSNSIIVNLEEKGQTAVCSVEDFGNGIAKDQQERIFEKFYKVNEANGANHAGLGLGLYIAIEIIKQHDGQMLVMSEPGLGSTFYFSLPVSTT